MGFRFTDEIEEAIREWDGILSAPSARNRKRLDGVQVFKSPFMERFFGTAHPILPGLWTLPLAVFCVYLTLSDPGAKALIALPVFVGGMLAWSLTEYILHRFPFHMKTDASYESKFRVFMMHGYHHEFPNDRYRLVAPPIMAWPPAAMFGAFFYLTVGEPYWSTLMAGMAIGYLAYDWIHFYTHHFIPKNRIGKFIRRYHMEHHFKDQTSHFGISSPLWDLVFGTYSTPTEPNEIELELVGDGGLPKAGRPRISSEAAEPSA